MHRLCHRASRVARRVRAGRCRATPAHAQRLLVPMDDAQQNHLKAYGLTYNALKAGATAEWLLNYRGGSFLLADTPELRRQAGLDGHHASSRSTTARLGQIRARDRGEQHGRGAAREGAEDRGLHAARRAAVGRRRDARAQVRGHRVHADLRRRGRARRPVEVRLAAPAPRGLHRAAQQVLPELPRRALVHRPAAEEHGGGASGSASRNIPALKKDVAEKIREFVERGGFLFAMCGATETLELAIAGAERRHRAELHRRHADGPRRRREDGLEAHVRVPRRAPRAVAVRELDERHRRAPGERAGPPPAARHVHAVRLLGEVRSGARRCSCRIIAP